MSAALDVSDRDRFGDTLQSHHAVRVEAEAPVLDQAPRVAFEEAVADGIEADQRDEKPDVRLGGAIAEHEAPAVAHPILLRVVRLEDLSASVLVVGLAFPRTGPMDAEVEVVPDVRVQGVDRVADVSGMEAGAGVRETAEPSMQGMSADSWSAIVPRWASHGTGTLTRPGWCGSTRR